MRLCKFTHETSILWREDRIQIIGGLIDSRSAWYDFREDIGGPIVDVVNLDEGLCHLLLASGGVYQVQSDPAVVFKLQRITA